MAEKDTVTTLKSAVFLFMKTRDSSSSGLSARVKKSKKNFSIIIDYQVDLVLSLTYCRPCEDMEIILPK